MIKLNNFLADYKKYYKGEFENIDVTALLKEVSTSIQMERDIELKAYESNMSATITFFFNKTKDYIFDEDDEIVEEAEFEYSGNSWK